RLPRFGEPGFGRGPRQFDHRPTLVDIEVSLQRIIGFTGRLQFNKKGRRFRARAHSGPNTTYPNAACTWRMTWRATQVRVSAAVRSEPQTRPAGGIVTWYAIPSPRSRHVPSTSMSRASRPGTGG